MTIAETAKNMTFPQIHCAITSASRRCSRPSSVSTGRSRTAKNVQPSNILFATARRPGNKRLPSPVKLVIL